MILARIQCIPPMTSASYTNPKSLYSVGRVERSKILMCQLKKLSAKYPVPVDALCKRADKRMIGNGALTKRAYLELGNWVYKVSLPQENQSLN